MGLVNLEAVERKYRLRRDMIEGMALLEERQGPQPCAMREAVELFQSLFKHCPFPAWMKSDQGVMLATNPAYKEIYGMRVTDESYVGRTDRDAWPVEEALRFAENDRLALQEGSVVTAEKIFSLRCQHEELLIGSKWSWTLSGDVRVVVGMVSHSVALPKGSINGDNR